MDLHAVQGTLKSLLQHHSLKASVLQCSVFFMVQPSHLYMTTGTTIALTIQIFISKVMSLLFNMPFRFAIAFPPRNKCLLISWLKPQFAVTLEPKKRKPVTVSTFSPSMGHSFIELFKAHHHDKAIIHEGGMSLLLGKMTLRTGNHTGIN